MGAGSVTKVILWDVDTQVDFMLPDGKLYVPEAEETIPAMKRLVEAAREAGIVHVASADDHELTDPEISDDPDFRNTYPPHCLRGTRGAQKIPETEQDDPLPLALLPFPPGLIPGLDRRPPRDPASEEELQRLHEPEHGSAARRARPGRDRRLRRRHRRLRRRGDPRLPAARPPGALRRGRRARPRRGARSGLHGGLARGRRRVHDRRRGRGKPHVATATASAPRCR